MGISTNQQRIYFFAGYLRLAMLIVSYGFPRVAIEINDGETMLKSTPLMVKLCSNPHV